MNLAIHIFIFLYFFISFLYAHCEIFDPAPKNIFEAMSKIAHICRRDIGFLCCGEDYATLFW